MAASQEYPHTIETPLARAVFLARLGDAIDEESENGSTLFTPYRGLIAVGRVSGERFRMRLRASQLGSFSPVIEGIVESSGERSLIRYRVRLDSRTVFIMRLYCGGLALMFAYLALVVLLGTPSTEAERYNQWLGLFQIAAMGILVPLILWLTAKQRARETAILEGVLREAASPGAVTDAA